MLKDLGNGYTQGDYLYYHDVGLLVPGGKTRKYEVCNRDSNQIIGHVKWFSHWRQYVFYPLNCLLNFNCLREIADFCQACTLEQMDKWKKPKYKFRKKYDMTHRNELRAQGVKNV